MHMCHVTRDILKHSCVDKHWHLLYFCRFCCVNVCSACQKQTVLTRCVRAISDFIRRYNGLYYTKKYVVLPTELSHVSDVVGHIIYHLGGLCKRAAFFWLTVGFSFVYKLSLMCKRSMSKIYVVIKIKFGYKYYKHIKYTEIF